MDQNSPGLQGKTAAPLGSQNENQKSSPSYHQTNVNAPVPIIHTQRLSHQELSAPTPIVRRVSIQEPPASLFLPHRLSTQISSLPTILPRRTSVQESPSQGLQPSTHDMQSIAYSRWLNSREASSISPTSRFGVLSSHALGSVRSEIQSLQANNESRHSVTQSHARPSVDVPPSLTQSPAASIGSFESFIWDSEESLKEFSCDSLSSQNTEDNTTKVPSTASTMGSTRTNSKSWSLLPIGWRLLLEGKKISRYLSLVLTVAGMVMLSLIALWQPWIHFQVPLTPPEDPTGPNTIPIDTIFFMRCPDISCMNEYDKNAYLLDLAWACLLISGIMSFCVCMGLISTIFFPSTNLPLMDFSLFVCSLMTGVSIILGVLFYLMQARKFLQEGMTYMLGNSFYLAWINVFFFSMTGLFSYLNYMNFWSILARQAIWS
ncbi:uncharacterized protein LOC127192388 [Acomys russatus]|uniref:uncharacterized protein LOC127192388 n=1 Tax=Acomys russatus TaxID=60746 RepID=UPI0021E29DEC|nr:uncharacterized protein LOC127192388 [Acomys russatus]